MTRCAAPVQIRMFRGPSNFWRVGDVHRDKMAYYGLSSGAMYVGSPKRRRIPGRAASSMRFAATPVTPVVDQTWTGRRRFAFQARSSMEYNSVEHQ